MTDYTADEIGVLSMMEQLAFRVARRMNQGRAKIFWTRYQRAIPARLIQFAMSNLLRVHGIEQFDRTSVSRPVLLISNHRSFFDMYVVSSMLVRRTNRQVKTYFPVRARFFYDSPAALAINALAAGWSMYPPFFQSHEKRAFNTYALRVLADLCRSGEGHLIGYHPEGTRNRGADPYTFLRPQPGIGQLVLDTAPQVIPVFVAGLDNSVVRQVRRNWRRGTVELVRIHFGPPLDLAQFLGRERRARTYKEIADFLMQGIAMLAEQDRALYAVAKPVANGQRDERSAATEPTLVQARIDAQDRTN
ncbi:MAG: lysophospholipid acyltransferase family protein [Gemmatimonadaceae bacterium]